MSSKSSVRERANYLPEGLDSASELQVIDKTGGGLVRSNHFKFKNYSLSWKHGSKYKLHIS